MWVFTWVWARTFYCPHTVFWATVHGAACLSCLHSFGYPFKVGLWSAGQASFSCMKLQAEAIWKHSTLQCYRIESLRLDKTSKIIQSNLQLNTTIPAKAYHKVPCLFISWTLPSNSTTSLGSLLQCLTTPSVKKSFPISTLNLPWCHMRPFPFVLSLAAWEKRPTLNGTSQSHETPQPGLSCCLKAPWEWKQVP